MGPSREDARGLNGDHFIPRQDDATRTTIHPPGRRPDPRVCPVQVLTTTPTPGAAAAPKAFLKSLDRASTVGNLRNEGVQPSHYHLTRASTPTPASRVTNTNTHTHTLPGDDFPVFHPHPLPLQIYSSPPVPTTSAIQLGEAWLVHWLTFVPRGFACEHRCFLRPGHDTRPPPLHVTVSARRFRDP